MTGSLLYKFLLWLAQLIGKKAADKYVDKLFSRESIYIDRCKVRKLEDSIKFDLTISSTFQQPVSIIHFKGHFYNKKGSGIHGNGGVQKISSEYKILNGLDLEIDGQLYNNEAQAWNNGRRLMFDCSLYQTIEPNSIDRFTIKWIMVEPIQQYDLVDIKLEFSVNQAPKETKSVIMQNPHFDDRAMIVDEH